MKIILKFIVGLMLSTSTALIAQDQKSKLKEWGDTELTCFGNNCNSTENYKLSLHEIDDPYMWYAQISSQYRTANYYAVPEQQPYPIFLTKGTDWGDDKMIYFLNFTSQGGNYYNKSILIIDDLLYVIEEEQNHSWKAHQIFSKDNYKGVKGMIAKEKKIKELAQIDHDKIVNDYINSQKEILSAKTPEYKAKNQEYYDRFKLEKGWANQDISDSYEILKEQRITNVVRVKNNKANTVFIGFDGPGSIPNSKLKPGDEITIECNLADIYLFLSNDSNREPVKFLFTPEDWCGKQYIIN
ncbi:hypothetical protein [Crocinitomix algicola]|uniref:hypothetical protein n=1 Tax=Crocinitomix algicola TaxID=1740263 RepID=UPI000871DD3F|nr:hypothetical protein [Crocinitomix algicola]